MSHWILLRFQMIIHECHQPTSSGQLATQSSCLSPKLPRIPIAAHTLFLSSCPQAQLGRLFQQIRPKFQNRTLIPPIPSVRMSVPHVWGPLRPSSMAAPHPGQPLSVTWFLLWGWGRGQPSASGPGSTAGKDHTWGTRCSIAKAGKPSRAHQNFPLSYSDAPPASMAGNIGWPGHRKISDL